MAPKTLARSRIADVAGWAHPAWYRGPLAAAVCYADGGDDPAPPGGTEPDSGGDGAPAVEPEPEDEWKPPTREEYEELLAAKAKADGEAATRRKYLKQHGINPRTGERTAPTPAPSDDEPEEQTAAARQGEEPRGQSPAEVKRAVEKAQAEGRIEGMRGAKKLVSNFNSALSEAGWNGRRLELIMPLVDFDDVDPDDPDDLKERVERAKKLYPEGFKRGTGGGTPAPKTAGDTGQSGTGGARVDTAPKEAPEPEPKSWADRLAQRALRG